MIVDRKRGYIFVHVPKTGGQSISKALGGKTGAIPTHTPLFSIEKGDCFAFGFIRNPWDRMVSLYSFLCQKQFKNTDNFKKEKVRGAGFKRWLMEDEFYMKEDYQLPIGESWVVGGHGEFPPMQRRSQLWWLKGCDYIGRFESLSSGYHEVCKQIGMSNGNLSHINKTKHAHYSRFYDSETIDFIAKHFQPEIELFGYSFEDRHCL
jgi:hypothetical protein